MACRGIVNERRRLLRPAKRIDRPCIVKPAAEVSGIKIQIDQGVCNGPALTPFSPSAAVSVSQASASVPATGAMNCMIAECWPRKCVR